MEGRLSTLFGLPGPSTSNGSVSAVDAQQKRIADRVWSAVERVMGDMRAALFSRLRDGEENVEEQEKTLEYVPSPSCQTLWISTQPQDASGP